MCGRWGMAVVALGGGRTRPQDIDHAVGFTAVVAPGARSRAECGAAAAPLRARRAGAVEAERRIRAAVTVAEPGSAVVHDPRGLVAHRHVGDAG